MKVCHITTAHNSKDVRIFHKECKSLAKAGYQVTLIVINGDSFKEDGVEVIGVSCKFSGRLQRFRKAAAAAYQKAIEINADIYHFHDPEFLPFAGKLQKKGKKVIYDVHEDLPRQILNKYYIPKPARHLIAFLVERYENRAAKKLDYIITATPFIKQRFIKINPNTQDINNFPVLETYNGHPSFEKNKVCYVGGISEIRGIKELVIAISKCNDIELALAGSYSPDSFRNELINTKGWEKVIEYGFSGRKTVNRIMNESFAGVVTLLPIPNYLDSLPVKMFEYMAAGISVIASGFPLWKEIVEKNDCGICVNPEDPGEIAEAILFLSRNKDIAKKMGDNGRKLVNEKYNWGIEEKKLLKAYNVING